MKTLAFDLANFQSSITLVDEEVVLWEQTSEVFRGQDVTLLPLIQQALSDHDLSVQDLDLIVTTSGPGSFTGIRVALATAQGLSLASGVPAIAIDSFSWVYQSFDHQNCDGLVVLESLRDDVYVQTYVSGEKGDPVMILKSDLDALNNQMASGAFVIGNGAHYVKGFTEPAYMPTALALAKLAQTIDVADYEAYPLVPFYVRPPDITKGKRA